MDIEKDKYTNRHKNINFPKKTSTIYQIRTKEYIRSLEREKSHRKSGRC